jgi:rsbT co-antagonist protein RsbR
MTDKETKEAYMKRRLGTIFQAVNSFSEGNFDVDLPVEDSDDELDLISIGLNIMKAEFKKLEDMYVTELQQTKEKLAIIEQQKETISSLSTPIIQVWDGILSLPVIGIVDSKRATDMMDNLLTAIVETRTKYVIIDITGVDVVDTKTADYFIKMVKAVWLLGTKCYITGINPAIAQTLTHIGVDLTDVATMRTLQDALQKAFSKMGIKVSKAAEDEL